MNEKEQLSKQFKKRKNANYYILGFTDAEGCFNVSLKKQEGTRFGWVLDPVFHITQHKNAKPVLEFVKEQLNCGRIIPKPGQEEVLQFIVDNRKQLAEKIIPFFSRYRLVVKARDFESFKEIVTGLEKKEHSTREGFERLLRIAFSMNMNGKQRRYKLDEILKDLAGSSETIRQTPEQGEDIVQPTQ
jgi:hypothetical protein